MPITNTSSGRIKTGVIQNTGLALLAKFLDLLLLLCILLVVLAYFNKGAMPPPAKLSPLLQNEPIQKKTDKREFYFKYQGNFVTVTPLASYEIWGLVASHNDINSWVWGYNADDVNLKDLCLLWGKNLETGVYQRATIYNKQWTCYVEYGAEDARNFVGYQLSNNHLLSDNAQIRDTIRKVRVGDQVHIKGLLVSYLSKDAPNGRKSSLTRYDAGNGACEVLFVNDIEILQQATPRWYAMFTVGSWLILVIIIVRIVVILADIFVVSKQS